MNKLMRKAEPASPPFASNQDFVNLSVYDVHGAVKVFNDQTH